MSSTCCCFSTIVSGQVGAIQTFGKFTGLQQPGCACIFPPFITVQPVSLALEQIDCRSTCKTKDNVTVTVVTAVQYRIMKDMVQTAVFDVSDPVPMMKAEVDSVLRSTMPTMTLDESYEAKDKMVSQIKTAVSQAMAPHGHEIINVLMTDITADPNVLKSMNEINAARRQREAALERGEADKILKIKAAEAEAEAKRLSGVGVAHMRAAIAQGFGDSMKFMTQTGMSEDQAMHMMIMTQYLDTLKDFAGSHGTIVVPHGPSAVKDLESQIREGFLTSATPPQQQMRSKGTAAAGGGLFG
mmetsp:Transcript_51788/g.93000  ORF Transcript_51788/g.93000 Transcript_51788/m.93000 type:complete len:299 (-) Transcript_51788:221-1117(-)|eukprot:CAMPEP_0197652098 /NCGR_PEP_ID=MMETSP1338-20131121/34242_1 /TAXON_ID=43686 ORGANISM="Pelagodinium beii, Strain RCC1491" /NCGR_SAMPLE_ID=MMETSP1338 /ASSEMBLY_ACC=CAM_ASM_000754 /LENGTH=298 /DNA_ID=CAMNT_0043226897 /DNA_START=72 /DNA_END=968 /DNA_ORIENTATION=-